jgi:hypothetical protein
MHQQSEAHASLPRSRRLDFWMERAVADSRTLIPSRCSVCRLMFEGR